MPTQTFEEWMHDADALCEARFGVSIHDLPDMSFRDAYDDGLTPHQFVAQIGPSDLF